jgi:hypothetical protein
MSTAAQAPLWWYEPDKEILGNLGPILEKAGVAPPHRQLVCRSLFLDGNSIDRELKGDLLPSLVRDVGRTSARPASIRVVADLTALRFEDQQRLRRQVTQAGGTLSARPATVTFQDYVDARKAAILEASRFTLREAVTPLHTGPKQTFACANPLSDSEFRAFLDALGKADDSSSIAS